LQKEASSLRSVQRERRHSGDLDELPAEAAPCLGALDVARRKARPTLGARRFGDTDPEIRIEARRARERAAQPRDAV
jgi:hypothetical protein